MEKDQITTKVIPTKKPHDKFQLRMQLDSTPVELTVEAHKTDIKLAELTPNPRKYSFGKIAFKTGILETYNYPLTNLDAVLWSFRKSSFREKYDFSTDRRKLREIRNLMEKISYFLGLSKERRLRYLQKKKFFANINIMEDKMSSLEREILESIQGVLKIGYRNQ